MLDTVFIKFQISVRLLSNLLFIFLASLAGALQAQGVMFKVRSEIIESAYLNLVVEEYKFIEPQRGNGGALAVVGNFLVLGTAQDTFIKINPDSMMYEKDYLPKLDVGEIDLENSKRYTYRELKPRIEGLIYFKDTYFVTYTRYKKRGDYIHYVLSKFDSSQRRWKDVWESIGLDAPYYALGTGGKMAGKGGKLFFTVGDFSLDRINGLPSDVAPQNKDLPWGKVNFIDLETDKFHQYSLGHRNPQGLAIMSDGAIILSEHGPQGGDELNLLREGANYGWPYESFGTKYGSFREYKDDLPPNIATSNYQPPLYSFVPSPAISQLVQISHFDPKWNGNILLGSLKAKTLFNIKIQDERVIYSEPIKIGHRVRDIKELNSTLYILTDDGSILVIRKQKP